MIQLYLKIIGSLTFRPAVANTVPFLAIISEMWSLLETPCIIVNYAIYGTRLISQLLL